MSTNAEAIVPTEAAAAAPHKAVRSHIRGSTLLLAGRGLYKGLNFAAQVVLVRFLSQSDYGALAYAVAIVFLLQNVAAFGLSRTVTRFLPAYEEERRYDRVLGTLLMSLGLVVGLGLLLVVATYACRGLLGEFLIDDERTLRLLLLLVFLTPLGGLDQLLVGLYAVFAGPRAIFFRRHVLGPALKLLVVLALVLTDGDVFVVAIGYLAMGLVGTAAGLVILWKFLRKRDLFRHFSLSRISVPWRELLLFTVPVLTSELLMTAISTIDVVLVEHFGDVTDVAAFRAVYPLALMNEVMVISFSTLFMPLASRMIARNDHQGVNDLFWQTTAWIAVFSIPIFALTFAMAQPVTLLLYGERYAGSAAILAWLSLGSYVNAATGMNSLALKTYGCLRFVLLNDLAAVALNFVIVSALVPRYGVVGAAIGTCIAVIAHTTLVQWALSRKTSVRFFEPRYFPLYTVIAAAAAVLWIVQQTVAPPVYVGLVLAAAASLLVLWCSRRMLGANQVFPELLRIPLLCAVLKK